MQRGKFDFITTHSGNKFWFGAEIDPESICIKDIAFSLSNLNRFGGHVGQYSVAEHSIFCAQIAKQNFPSLTFEALMHDAAEAYIGDVVRPLKRQLSQYKDYEKKLEYTIAKKWNLDFSNETSIKTIDNMALYAEAKYFFKEIDDWGLEEFKNNYKIEPKKDAKQVEAEFLDLFNTLWKERNY